MQALEQDGGKLARRLSGGGAVYHDMGNQNFTFIARKAEYNLEKQTEVIRQAARGFGIEVVRSGRNDILAGGRKFSGNAFYNTGDYCYHHGTILINSNMAKLGKYLNPSPEKLAGKGVASVQARVVNLAELAPGITPESMRKALRMAFEKVYGTAAQTLAQSLFSTDKLNVLTGKYTSAKWRMGQPFPYSARIGQRLSFGEVEILLQAEQGKVCAAKVFTDAMEPGWAESLEAALTGERLDTATLPARIRVLENAAAKPVLEEIAGMVERYFAATP